MTLEPLLLACLILTTLLQRRIKRRHDQFEQERRHKRHLMGLRDKLQR